MYTRKKVEKEKHTLKTYLIQSTILNVGNAEKETINLCHVFIRIMVLNDEILEHGNILPRFRRWGKKFGLGKNVEL